MQNSCRGSRRVLAAMIAALVLCSAAGTGASVAAEAPATRGPAPTAPAKVPTPPQPAEAYAWYLRDFTVRRIAPNLPGYTKVEQLYDGVTWTSADAGDAPTPLIYTRYRVAYKVGNTRGPWRETAISPLDRAPSLRWSRDSDGITLNWKSSTGLSLLQGYTVAWFGDGEWRYTYTTAESLSFPRSLELARVAVYTEFYPIEFRVTSDYAEIEVPSFGAVRDLAYTFVQSKPRVTWTKPESVGNRRFTYDIEGSVDGQDWRGLGTRSTPQYNFTAADADIIQVRVRARSGGEIGDWAEITIDRSRVLEVAIGHGHACALVIDGTVECWGYNKYGQTGSRPGKTTKKATKVKGLPGIVDIDVGYFHTCALDGQGKVWCWGYNESGQLGDGTTTARQTPKVVSGLAGVTSLATGFGHTCVALGDGSVRCWGDNTYYQSGPQAAEGIQTKPVVVRGVDDIVQISAGRGASCAVSRSFPAPKSIDDRRARVEGVASEVWCWGDNIQGSLGNGNDRPSAQPTKVVDLDALAAPISNVALGADFGCAHVQSEPSADFPEPAGLAVCWGAASYGQLGQFEPYDTQFVRPIIAGSYTLDVASISTGGYHSCAVKFDQTVWCSGDDSYGQIGDGPEPNYRRIAEQVPDFTATMVDAGVYSTCAVDTKGDAWCWGENVMRQLGDGSATNRSSPVRVRGL